MRASRRLLCRRSALASAIIASLVAGSSPADISSGLTALAMSLDCRRLSYSSCNDLHITQHLQLHKESWVLSLTNMMLNLCHTNLFSSSRSRISVSSSARCSTSTVISSCMGLLSCDKHYNMSTDHSSNKLSTIRNLLYIKSIQENKVCFTVTVLTE